MRKTALITGASQGIGAGIAKRLAKDGFNIAINTIDKVRGDQVAEECKAMGVEAEVFIADVSKYGECENMVKEVKAKFNTIDVLINNAGITADGLLARMTEENYDKVIAVNQKSIFNMMKFVSGIMIKQKSGKIINMSSVSGVHGNPGQFNYSASKAAVVGMTKSAAKELAVRGINVNAIAPGFIKTEMTNALTDEQKQNITNQIAMKKIGEIEDVAALASFLASNESSYITGQVIEISGGLVM